MSRLSRRASVVMTLTSLFLAISSSPAAAGPLTLGGTRPAPASIFLPGQINRSSVGTSGSAARRHPVATGQPIGRTRTSNTYSVGGQYRSVIYPGSINYKDASGHWQPIDNTLVPSSVNAHAYTNKANRYRVDLPADLGLAPIRVSASGAWLDFTLRGARGAPITKGNSQTFSDALPGVTVGVTVANDATIETLTLPNLSAATDFVYDLRLSPGLNAVDTGSGVIEFRDSSGKSVLAFAAPAMYDASGINSRSRAIALKLVTTPVGVAITVSPDRKWLSDPIRRWPVVIDPDVQVRDQQDCYMQNPGGTFNDCGSSRFDVGNNGSWVFRSMMRFDVSSVPSSATVVQSELHMDETWAQNSSSVPVSIHQLTHSYTTAATWYNYDGTHPWTTAGGDFNPTATDTETLNGTLGWYMWFPDTSLVQGWVNGSIPNNGFLMKAVNESTVGAFELADSLDPNSANWPNLQIYYDPGVGERSYFKFETQQLSDRMYLRANVADGNLLLHAHDASIAGTGLNLTLDRYYNNLSTYNGDLGSRWSMTTGWDVYLMANADGSQVYHGPTGYALLFTKSGSTFTTPAGLDAKLTQNPDSSYVLKFNQSGEKYNFNSYGTLVSDVDKDGNTISFAYDGNGRLASITDTQSRVTTFGYNYAGNSSLVTLITDPAGRQYQYGYTGNNLTSYTDPWLKVTRFGYDTTNNNDLIQVTDPVGNITKLTYVNPTGIEGDHRVASITRVTNPGTGAGYLTSYAYNSGNTVVTDPNNHQTTYYYDSQNRVTKVVDALGHSRQTSYTSNSNVQNLTDGLSAVTQLTYDNNNNLSQIQSPSSSQGQTAASTRFGYQAPGQTYLPSSRTDAQGNCRAFSYDTAGNLQNVYDGQSSPCDGHTGGASYTNAYQGDNGTNCGAKNGELCSSTDPKGYKTTYGYDTYGNPTAITPPAVTPPLSTTITYDGISRVTSVTDGKAQKTSFSYDALDRITQVLYGGATQCTSSSTCTTYSYDGAGNLKTRVDNTGTTTFAYDTLNRLTNKALPDTTTACTGSVPLGMTFAYDGVGNMTAYCDAGGLTAYGYDQANRLTGMAEPGGSCSAPASLCTTFGYDNADHRTSLTFPGAATLNLAYDSAGNETSAIGKSSGGTVLTSFTYCYQTLVNSSCPTSGGQDRQVRTRVIENDPVASLTTSYTYDAFNRLYDATNSSTSLHYRYDANGNRCSTALDCASPTYQYNAANEMTSASGVTYAYDGNGNETSTSSGASFTYNVKNQTTAITRNGITLSPLTYADADQTERTVVGSTTLANGPLGPMLAKSGGTSTYYLRDSRGQLIGQRGSDGSHWYFLKDGLGSTVAVISGNGSQIGARYGYDPYGQSTYQSGTVTNPWHFAGGYLDVTGLYKFGTRYYDPSVGRWTQQDPIGGSIASPSEIDRYLYVADNPLNKIDPSGRDDFWYNLGQTLGEVATQGAVCLGGARLGLYFAIPFEAFAPESSILAAFTGCVIGLDVYYASGFNINDLGDPPA